MLSAITGISHISKAIRAMSLAAGLTLYACGLAFADPIFFIGIGNPTANDPSSKSVDTINDILKEAAKLKNTTFHSQVIKGTQTNPAGRVEIETAINSITNQVRAGATVILYYLGHGASADRTAGHEDTPTDSAETKGDEWIGDPNDRCTDDQVAEYIDRLHPNADKVLIVDSCYSGGMIGGGQDLDKRPEAQMGRRSWLLSQGEDECDPGLDEYGSYLKDALTKGGDGRYKGDKDKDGDVDVGEWLGYAVEQRGGTWGGSYDPGNTIVPEPASLLLVALGGAILLRLKARRQ